MKPPPPGTPQTFIPGSDLLERDRRRHQSCYARTPFEIGPWEPRPLDGRKLTCVDLFSGLGGFSSGFVDDPRWDVFRVELMEQFPATVHADIMAIGSDVIPHRPDLLVASPPCTTFSNMSRWRYWWEGVPTFDAMMGIGLVAKTFWLIQKCEPVYWVVENPRGVLREVLGFPTTTQYWGAWGHPYYKPTDLWARFPGSIRLRGKPRADQITERVQDMRGETATLANVRAVVPRDFSLELKRAVEADYGLAPPGGEVYIPPTP